MKVLETTSEFAGPVPHGAGAAGRAYRPAHIGRIVIASALLALAMIRVNAAPNGHKVVTGLSLGCHWVATLAHSAGPDAQLECGKGGC